MAKYIQHQRRYGRHEAPVDDWAENSQQSARCECTADKASADTLDTLLELIEGNLRKNDESMDGIDQLPPQ